MPAEDCFVHRSMFIDGRIPRVDDRRLPCLGGGFLGGEKVLSTGEEGLGNRRRRRTSKTNTHGSDRGRKRRRCGAGCGSPMIGRGWWGASFAAERTELMSMISREKIETATIVQNHDIRKKLGSVPLSIMQSSAVSNGKSRARRGRQNFTVEPATLREESVI